MPRIVIASLVMGAVLYALAWALVDQLHAPGLRYVALAAVVILGSASYFAAAHTLGALRMNEVRATLRRKPKA